MTTEYSYGFILSFSEIAFVLIQSEKWVKIDTVGSGSREEYEVGVSED